MDNLKSRIKKTPPKKLSENERLSKVMKKVSIIEIEQGNVGRMLDYYEDVLKRSHIEKNVAMRLLNVFRYVIDILLLLSHEKPRLSDINERYNLILQMMGKYGA